MLNSPAGEGDVLQLYSKLLLGRIVSDTGVEPCAKLRGKRLVVPARTRRGHKLMGNLRAIEVFIQRENTRYWKIQHPIVRQQKQGSVAGRRSVF
jgi:hypothetical protein